MDALVQNSKEHNLAAYLKPPDGGMHPCVIVPDYHEVYHVARPVKRYQTASTFVVWDWMILCVLALPECDVYQPTGPMRRF